MADRDHPKTHVEDQDLDELRKQPESPLHEGIDPLTEGDTMLPRENVKADSARLAKKEAKLARDTASDDATAQTVADQKELAARENTPNSNLDEGEKTATTSEKEKAADTASEDTTDKETGTENTSASNKTVGEGASEDVKSAEKPVETKTPKSGTAGSKTSQR